MKKRVLLVIACGALCTGAAGSAATRTAGPGKPTATINFLEIETGFAASVPENEAPKLGDQFWSHSEFYKWNGGKRGAHFGHADAHIVFLNSDKAQITAVASLPGGTLSVVGLTGNQRVTTLPIVGGTGAYATARGEVVLRTIGGPNSNKSSDTIQLWS
jgi:hypothetical protein